MLTLMLKNTDWSSLYIETVVDRLPLMTFKNSNLSFKEII